MPSIKIRLDSISSLNKENSFYLTYQQKAVLKWFSVKITFFLGRGNMVTRIPVWKNGTGPGVCKDKDWHLLFTGKSRVNVVVQDFSVSVDSCSLHYTAIHLPSPLIGCPQDIGPEFHSETSKHPVATQDPDTSFMKLPLQTCFLPLQGLRCKRPWSSCHWKRLTQSISEWRSCSQKPGLQTLLPVLFPFYLI